MDIDVASVFAVHLPNYHRFSGYLIIHSIPHSITFDQETHFTANKIQQYTHSLKIYRFIMFSIMLKQLAWWDDGMAPWGSQLQQQLGGNILQGWSNVL